MQEIFDAVDKLLAEGSSVIAIDGCSAAGKSTLAGQIAECYGIGVVHMDDFFLPFDMRTPERLGEPGGNLHRERFLEEVVPMLGKDFSYRIFSCSDGSMNERRRVPSGSVIVEGAYSMHPAFGDIYDLRVFMDISPELQQRRIIERDGENWWQRSRDVWIPMENYYHQAMNIRKKCDIVLMADSIDSRKQ